jgi:hypothetical protein
MLLKEPRNWLASVALVSCLSGCTAAPCQEWGLREISVLKCTGTTERICVPVIETQEYCQVLDEP